ncbi:TonB-dependent receptor [Parapedobacter tibetensis]|uniref:TonB-dependent receptor n=1 Tax=Parapedobacter tibetensis TaxID=2972951 RepID=UPI00214D81C4|nr:TonB-dependent receptor [Parapedobacter tibetensis]
MIPYLHAIYKHFRGAAWCLLVLALTFQQLYAQRTENKFIQGRIVDASGVGIPGATITVAQQGPRAATDSEGRFWIALGESRRLAVTHVNYNALDVRLPSPVSADSLYTWLLVPKTTLLDDVSVTASATPMQLRKIASSVSVLKQSDAELRQIQTIDEALGYLPGVAVDRSRGLTTTGAHTSIVLRGTGSANRTLILKDGVPINDSYTGGVSEWNSLASNSIERIEVVRGPGSSIYGSSSMGGTVNLVTQSPGDRPVLGADLRYGSMNTFQTNIKAGKRFGNGWGAIAFAEYKKTDGYAYMADSLWQSYYQKPRMELLNVNAKLAYDLPVGGTFTAIADYNLQQPESGTSTIYDDRTTTGNFQLRYADDQAKVKPEIIAYYNRQDRKSNSFRWNAESRAFDNRYYDSEVPLDTYGLIAKANQTWYGNSITLGADLRFTKVQSHKFYYGQGDQDFSGNQNFISFFLNDDISIGERLHVNAGLRFDHWSNKQGHFFDNMSGEAIDITYDDASSDIFTPKLGLTYDFLPNFRLRTVYATGFKAPSSYYLYNATPLGTSFRLGNPSLKPERMAYSVDFGADFQLGNRLEISATVYASQYSDFLTSVLIDRSEVPSYFDPGNLPVRQYINIGKVNLRGLESFVRYRIGDGLSLQASYFHNRSEIIRYETNPEYEGKEMNDNPKHSLSGAVVFDKTRWFHLSAWARHTGSHYGDLENTPDKTMAAVTVFDLKLGKSVGPVSINLNVMNLFDKQYYGSYSSPTSYYYAPGRTFFTGISYQL